MIIKKIVEQILKAGKVILLKQHPNVFFNTAVEQLGIFNDRRNVCIILSA